MSRIKRRDFINGSLLAGGAALLPFTAGLAGNTPGAPSTPYPPALTGLRGSHPGSNDHAHARAWNGKSDWGPTTALDETYDLVVIGGGISGLSAAYYFKQQHGPGARILVLDNHDDFGGHARRNEHSIDGRTLISYGGSQTIVEPERAQPVVLETFRDIGIDLDRFQTAYDREFFRRHDLGAVTWFNADVFGEDRLVRHPFCNYPNYVEGIQMARVSDEEAVQQTPLSSRGKEQLLRVLKGGVHVLNVPEAERRQYLRERNYFDYLKEDLGVDDPAVLRMARHSALDWSGSSAELHSMASARACGALGFEPRAVYNPDHPYIHHYPDGNATIARALVKQLVPDVGPGETAEELLGSTFDYSMLDRDSNNVRIRLNSTAVELAHLGDPETAKEVGIKYIKDGQACQVKAPRVVLACYNMIIPHIVTDLPPEQAQALRQQLKSPLQYSTVGLRNWRAVKERGVGMALSPGQMHQAVLMDFPVSMGPVRFTDHPDQPCVLQLIACPYGTEGKPREEQYREARQRMLGLQFSDYEQEIRQHLGDMLGPAGFDFDRDVASISVNRWAHGYSGGGPGDTTRIGRQTFGRMAIANCDAVGSADAQVAMLTGRRAIRELASV